MKIKIFCVRIVIAAMCLPVFVACTDKDDVPGASYQPGVWFCNTNTGNVSTNGKFDMELFDTKFRGSYSFYFYPGAELDTFALAEIRLIGVPVDYDRKVNLMVGEGSTAVEGEHFEIFDNVLPANGISFVPKVLLIKKNLGEEEKVIKFVLGSSDEFPARVFGDTISDDKTFLISLRYELKFSNLLSEPPYWYQCNSQRFGKWSRVKYEFMYAKLGRYWGVESLSPSDMNDVMNDVYKMRDELDKWRKEHNNEVMKDENGKEIQFN